MPNRIFGILLLLVCAAVAPNRSFAAITVSFGTTSPNPLVAGSPGTIEVFITSDANDLLDYYLVQLGITPGGVAFSSAQSESHLVDSRYIFAGVSGGYAGAANAFGFAATDFTDNGSGPAPQQVSPPPANPLDSPTDLLLILDLDALSPGTYFIDIDPLSTDFRNENFDSIPFSSIAGEIVVESSVAAVPEPSSLALFLGAAGSIVLARSRGRVRGWLRA